MSALIEAYRRIALSNDKQTRLFMAQTSAKYREIDTVAAAQVPLNTPGIKSISQLPAELNATECLGCKYVLIGTGKTRKCDKCGYEGCYHCFSIKVQGEFIEICPKCKGEGVKQAETDPFDDYMAGKIGLDELAGMDETDGAARMDVGAGMPLEDSK